MPYSDSTKGVSRQILEYFEEKLYHPGIKLKIPEGIELMPFQKDACNLMLHFIHSRKAVYNGCEMGLGKTVQSCIVLNTMTYNHVLVISPVSALMNWAQECQKLLTHRPPIYIAFKATDVANIIEQHGKSVSSITIVPYSIIFRKDVTQLLTTRAWSHLILDESHRVKNRDAKTTRAILEDIWPRANYKICLSGTPFTRSAIDGYTLFSRMHSDLGTYWDYARRFCRIKTTHFGTEVFGSQNERELGEIIRSNFFVRYLKAEVLPELPPVTYQAITIPKSYSLKVKEKESQKALARAALEITAKIEQGVGYTVPEHFATHRREQALAKAPLVIEHIAEILEAGTPSIIFAYHKEVIAKIVNSFAKYNPSIIIGGTDSKDRQSQIDKFQNGTTNLFIGQLKAAGEAVNLTRAEYIALFEIDYSPAVIRQAIARANRIGQKSNILCQWFNVENSIETSIERVVMEKSRSFKEILAA